LASDRKRDSLPESKETLSEPDDAEDRKFLFSDDEVLTKDKGKGKGRKVDEVIIL
jgi:hypothetical protein